MSVARALGLLIGHGADRLLGDPRRGHPVAGFGRIAQWTEKVTYRDTRTAGVIHAAVLTVAGTGAAYVIESRLTRPWQQCAATAITTWAVLGGASLAREADTINAMLDDGDIPAARKRLTHLVGRRTEDLDADEIARAVVESVAENTSDAVVGPLVWGAVAGLPGLVGYRIINTLDAMVGHHTDRLENFGWASARADDLVNLVPARFAGILVGCLRPRAARDVMRIWARDAPAHPSPNSGVVEAAFAAALNRRLGGRNDYGEYVEDRAVLGDGPAIEVADIRRTRDLSAAVCWASAGVAAAVCVLMARRR